MFQEFLAVWLGTDWSIKKLWSSWFSRAKAPRVNLYINVMISCCRVYLEGFCCIAMIHHWTFGGKVTLWVLCQSEDVNEVLPPLGMIKRKCVWQILWNLIFPTTGRWRVPTQIIYVFHGFYPEKTGGEIIHFPSRPRWAKLVQCWSLVLKQMERARRVPLGREGWRGDGS